MKPYEKKEENVNIARMAIPFTFHSRGCPMPVESPLCRFGLCLFMVIQNDLASVRDILRGN